MKRRANPKKNKNETETQNGGNCTRGHEKDSPVSSYIRTAWLSSQKINGAQAQALLPIAELFLKAGDGGRCPTLTQNTDTESNPAPAL